MAKINPPKASEFSDIVRVDGPGRYIFGVSKAWFQFLARITSKLNAADDVPGISAPDAGAAPASYSQAHTASIVAELNETKARLNALIDSLKK